MSYHLTDAQRKRHQELRRGRRKADLERKGRSDRYSGLARALVTLAAYGGYTDIPKLMDEYDPSELDPPQLAEYFDVPALANARRFVDELIAWANR